MIIFSVRDDITKKKRLIESRIQSNKYGRFKKLVSKKTRKHANTMFGFDFYIKYKIHCLVPFLSLSLRKARVLRIVLIRLNNYKTHLHCTVKQKFFIGFSEKYCYIKNADTQFAACTL